MQKLINKVQVKAITTACFARKGLCRAKSVLSSKSGQGALDQAINVLIAIVLGALILGGLYLIINATVLPTITERIREMFNYKG